MRLARLKNRLVALVGDGAIDVAEVVGAETGNDVFHCCQHWRFVASRVAEIGLTPVPFDAHLLEAPVPDPRQVFAIGLNYKDHAAESGLSAPEQPAVSTKFPTCITGPDATVALPSAGVDYEVELVVVIGQSARGVTRDRAWDHVAGFMVGQDLSERSVQLAGPVPQFSLGKSYAGFAPTGPAVVGIEEIADPDALQIRCSIGDDVLQQGNTADLIFDVRDLIVRLSAVCLLLPGDLIFTGTPAGVGMVRNPPRFLTPGDELVSSIDTLGEIRTVFTAGPSDPEV